jgi:adenylate cyclase
MSLALLASAGFLALHALATPGVVLPGPNAGFVLATPIGLLVASGFAAVSAMELNERRAAALRRLQLPLRIGLIVVLVAWATVSAARLLSLDRVRESERAPWLLALLPFGIAAYAFAALRYAAIYRDRRRILSLAVAAAFVLLAEALVAVAFSRAWRLSWWEWHLLMTAAFASILLAARSEYRRQRSLTEAFGGLYLERTLERLDARHSAVLGELARATRDGSLDDVASRLPEQGFSADEVAVLTRSAHDLARVDDLLRRYVGPHLAERMSEDPGLAELGGVEREVSVLFADLVGFTTFSEGRPATEVVDMLNSYWALVVPEVVDRERGLIERFAGDAILAIFNALGDDPDHSVRAARAAVAIREASEGLRRTHPDWPRFRVGVNSGPAVLGNVGAGPQRSFTVIGDTANVAARLQTMAEPGRVVIGGGTLSAAGGRLEVAPLGPHLLKGRTEPTDAFELLAVRADRGRA